MIRQPTVALFGSGSWGTALAMQMARNGIRVNFWGHDPQHVENLRRDGENRAFLPGIKFDDNICPVICLRDCLDQADTVLIAIPSQAFRGFLQKLRPLLSVGISVFWASKGFEIETGKLFHEVISEVLPGHNYGVISGPTFAVEVARGLPAAITCAGNDPADTASFAKLLHGGRLRCYTSEDVIGVELGGALKNIIAIAVGIADGLCFGANTRAALMTRGLAEVMRLGRQLGARQETLMGLAGLGDLILTCTDDQSRNRRFGLAIGAGKTVMQAEVAIGQTVEGLRATRAVFRLSQAWGLELPIMEQVYRVLYDGLEPVDAVQNLESRPQRRE